MSSRRFRLLRTNTAVVLDHFTLAALAEGYTLFAGVPVGLIAANNLDVIPSVAAALVKQHGLKAIRAACEAEGIIEPGEALWIETGVAK